MNLNQLAVFQAVAQQGSVSRGAQQLRISQPAASKQIKELEASLQTLLFERLPSGVRLTQAGALLAEYARRLFALETEAEQALRELRGLERGRLVIGASLTISVYLLPEVLGTFHRRYPKIELQLEIANTDVIQQQLSEGKLDLGLTEGFAEKQDLTADVIGQDEIVAIAPPWHSLITQSSSVILARVCEEPLVMREAGSGTRAVVERAMTERSLVPASIVMSLGSTEAIKRAVAAGIGLAFVSRLAINLELSAGYLAIIPMADLTLRRPLHHLKRRGSRETRAGRAFMAELRHAFFASGLTRPSHTAIMTSPE